MVTQWFDISAKLPVWIWRVKPKV